MFLNKGILFSFIFPGMILFACSNEVDPLTAFNSGNYKQAFDGWHPKAQNGDISARNYLGIQYQLGLGVKEDIQKSVYWYKLAAKSGHSDAQRNLGMLYTSRKLGNPDFEQAYIWLYAAYQQGNKNAHKSLEAISGQLSPNRVEILKQQAKPYIINDIVDPENDDY